MKSNTTQSLTVLIVSLFAVASCTTVNIPEAYPPIVKTPKPRDAATAQKPTPIPEIKHPIEKAGTRPIEKPSVKAVIKPKPRKVIVRAYKPEQGDNPYDRVVNRATRTVSTAGQIETQNQTKAAPAPATTTTTSPAVKSLLTQAKAAMLIGRNAAAVEKMERALRIEARNPQIWHLLAKAHYNQKNDSTAISMAKKSNLYVSEGSPLEKQNWQVIKNASKRSENIKTLKAAILYERAHP